MTKFGHRTAGIHKNQVVGHALPSSAAIFAFGEEDGLHDSPLRDADVTNWKEEVNIGVECREGRQKVIELLEDFAKMCSVKPATIKATEHRTQLVPGARPIHQQRYRAGMKAREVEGQEFNCLLEKGIIEPS